MKLLLHACCAPCAIYPVKEAKKDNINISGFFYNPNIHPNGERAKRKRELEKYFKSERLPFLSEEHDTSAFFKSVKDAAPKTRCPDCWEMRLTRTVIFAKENGFHAFSTTLLGSPYQDHEKIKSICEALADKTKIKFYYKDFRAGFKESHKIAREKGIYCQNYCGCVFSIAEREEKRKTKNENNAPKK